MLAHQQVEQRGGLEVGHLAAQQGSGSRLRGQQPGQRGGVAEAVGRTGWGQRRHVCGGTGSVNTELLRRACNLS